MNAIPILLKKGLLVAVVLALALAILPLSNASGASLEETATPPSNPAGTSRLERLWAREQRRYERQGNLLAKADIFIAKAQTLIDKAEQKGWDVSAIQAALEAFSNAIPAAEAAHEPGAAIIRTHSGFNANGQVTDPAKAIVTVKALAQVLKDTRAAMDGTGRALLQAIRAFRQEHRNPVTPTP